MMFKCSLTLVVGPEEDAEVLSEERIASNPVVGLDLLWSRIKEQWSLLDRHGSGRRHEIQLLGWVDLMDSRPDLDMQVGGQKLIDSTRAREAEQALRKVAHQEQGRLNLDPVAGSDAKGEF